MINKWKAYRLRRKAQQLEQEINDLLDASIAIRATIINRRHEVLKIERMLLALGSTLAPGKELSAKSILACIAISLAMALVLAFVDDSHEVQRIESDRLAALTHKAESDRLMRQSNALVYPLAQVGIKP